MQILAILAQSPVVPNIIAAEITAYRTPYIADLQNLLEISMLTLAAAGSLPCSYTVTKSPRTSCTVSKFLVIPLLAPAST